MRRCGIIIALSLLLASCATRAPAPTAPEARAVPEREVLALVDELVGVAARPGFDVAALDRALAAGNSVDACRALALPPAACEDLGARVHAMAERLRDGAVVGHVVELPYRCAEPYRLCLAAGFAMAAATYRFPALIAGAMTIAALRCRCHHCPGGRIVRLCDIIAGL